MKNLAIAAIVTAAAFASCACSKPEKRVIEFTALPQAAQTFVQTHFADKQVAIVYRDRELFDKDYEVIFMDGSNVDFNGSGTWTEVEDRDANGVPTAIIPAAIQEYVTARHPGQYIVEISKDTYGYDVELNTTIELEFNKSGQIRGYDD
ncbi:MAG: PepSY-like domain-containing protein [Bacteroidales bacterium]|nr:PepSY-like domain-containing protein [Bacteroidales bacterium]